MFKATMEMKVLFDNKIEKTFYAQIEIEGTKEEAQKYVDESITKIKESIQTSYKDGVHGYLYVHNATIDIMKTSYIEVSLVELKEI